MLDNIFFMISASTYTFIIKIGSYLQSIFLLYMRISWGHLIFLIGLKKFHEMDVTIELFRELGILHPSWSAHLAGSFEVLCGACFVLGFASRLMAIPLIIIMITALGTAHAQDLDSFRFFLEPPALAHQAPYPYLVTALLLFVFGPGRFSVDSWLEGKFQLKNQ